MNQTNISRNVYLSALIILSVPLVWASFWYNKGAYNVVGSATQQMFLYLFPIFFIAARAWYPKVNHFAFILFFFLMVPLVFLTYAERDKDGWVYAMLELPVIWLFGIYAIISTRKYLGSKSKF